MNQFPAENGASRTLSPLTIMTGSPKPDFNDLRIEFGTYALVYESNDPTNTMKTRSTGAIALNPNGNTQGGYYFMSLSTGKRLSRIQWDELPMPDGVIARVEAMAALEDQPIMDNGVPIFEWAPNIRMVDDDEQEVIEVDVQEDDHAEHEEGVAPAEHADDILEEPQGMEDQDLDNDAPLNGEDNDEQDQGAGEDAPEEQNEENGNQNDAETQEEDDAFVDLTETQSVQEDDDPTMNVPIITTSGEPANVENNPAQAVDEKRR